MSREGWAPTPLKCVLLDQVEYRERDDARIAAITEWRSKNPFPEGAAWPDELAVLSRSFLPPGSMWFCPWYHDPADPKDLAKVEARIERALSPGFDGHLSIHYWTTWARIRPPINVVCPDFRDWVPDAKSSNGDGWTVTGEAPLITCSPSIWTSMRMGPDSYHGYLRDGVFTVPC